MPPPGKEPQKRGGEDSLGHDTRGGLERMNRRGLWAAGVVLILLVVGAGVLTVGTGYAQNENAAKVKCSEATLDGRYLFAEDGVILKGNDQRPFALAGYEVYNGNGEVRGVQTGNFGGELSRKEPFTGTYTVKPDCTATVTYAGDEQFDLFLDPDGSKFTLVQVKPSDLVESAFELRGTAKRVGN
jgi:hypothetical protein